MHHLIKGSKTCRTVKMDMLVTLPRDLATLIANIFIPINTRVISYETLLEMELKFFLNPLNLK